MIGVPANDSRRLKIFEIVPTLSRILAFPPSSNSREPLMSNETKWVELLLEIPAPASRTESFLTQSEAYVLRVKELCAKRLAGWKTSIRSAFGPSGTQVQIDVVFAPTLSEADRKKAQEAAQKAVQEADPSFVRVKKSA